MTTLHDKSDNPKKEKQESDPGADVRSSSDLEHPSASPSNSKEGALGGTTYKKELQELKDLAKLRLDLAKVTSRELTFPPVFGSLSPPSGASQDTDHSPIRFSVDPLTTSWIFGDSSVVVDYGLVLELGLAAGIAGSGAIVPLGLGVAGTAVIEGLLAHFIKEGLTQPIRMRSAGSDSRPNKRNGTRNR